MSEPLQIEVTGDGADAFREHFKIDSLEQAKSAHGTCGCVME